MKKEFEDNKDAGIPFIIGTTLCIINGIVVISWPFLYLWSMGLTMTCFVSHYFFAFLYYALVYHMSSLIAFNIACIALGCLLFLVPAFVYSKRLYRVGLIICLILGILTIATGILGIIAYFMFIYRNNTKNNREAEFGKEVTQTEENDAPKSEGKPFLFFPSGLPIVLMFFSVFFAAFLYLFVSGLFNGGGFWIIYSIPIIITAVVIIWMIMLAKKEYGKKG